MSTPIPSNQAAFTLAEVVEATGGRLRHSTQPGVGFVLGVSIDTRSLEPGSLFVALRGTTIDGHDYLARAAELGALGVCFLAVGAAWHWYENDRVDKIIRSTGG